MNKKNILLTDTEISVETPEGIAITVSPAGLAARTYAWIIDTLIRWAVISVSGFVLIFLGEVGAAIYMVLIFLLYWFYNVYFEVMHDGATPGKKAMRLKVLHDDTTPIGWSASIIRNFLRLVDFLPIVYLTGVCSLLLSSRFKRLGDYVAGTMVTYDEKVHGDIKLPEHEPINPMVQLNFREQQTILEFANRYSQINAERADELASRMEVLVGDSPEPAKRLLGIANWISGAR